MSANEPPIEVVTLNSDPKTRDVPQLGSSIPVFLEPLDPNTVYNHIIITQLFNRLEQRAMFNLFHSN